MRILAIDAATRSGWAARVDGHVAWGAVDIAALCSRNATRGERLAAAAGAYAALMAEWRPDLVLLESPFARGQATTRLLYGYAAAVEAAAHQAGAACLELEPSSVRKRVLGSGKLDDGKAQVITWARSQGYAIEDHQDDEADALLLLHAGAASARVVPETKGFGRAKPKRGKRALGRILEAADHALSNLYAGTDVTSRPRDQLRALIAAAPRTGTFLRTRKPGSRLVTWHCGFSGCACRLRSPWNACARLRRTCLRMPMRTGCPSRLSRPG